MIDIKDLRRIYDSWISYDIANEFIGMTGIKYVACQNCGLKYFFPPVAGSVSYYNALSTKMKTTYYQEEKKEYQFAGKFIRKDDCVLDIGSGCGHFKKYVPGQYTGLDFNPEATYHASNLGIMVLNESLEEHAKKIVSAPYSVITAFQVLEHIPEPVKFINICLSILKQDGLLILSVPSEDSFISLLENAVLNMPPHHVSRWSKQTLTNLPNIFDFDLLAIEHGKVEKIHYESLIHVIASRIIRLLLHLDNNSLIDISFGKKIIDKATLFIKPLLRQVFYTQALLPDGHSVTAVYKKRSINGDTNV